MRAAVVLFFIAGCSGSSFDISASPDDGVETDIADSALNDAASDSSAESDTITASDAKPDAPSPADAKADAKVDAKADTTVDAAPMCPAPRSTKTHEVTITDCTMLREQHGKAVNAAKLCNCDADCSDKLDPNLCGCQSYANPAREEYLLAIAIEDRFNFLGCPAPCGPLCKVPLAAKCVPFGTIKVCADQF